MDYQKHLAKAIDYVRRNKSWSKSHENYVLEQISWYRCPVDLVSEEIDEEISDLMNEYGEENNLPEDWWCSYISTDDIFFKL